VNQNCLDLAETLNALYTELLECKQATLQERDDLGSVGKFLLFYTLLELGFHLFVELFLLMARDPVEIVRFLLCLFGPHA